MAAPTTVPNDQELKQLFFGTQIPNGDAFLAEPQVAAALVQGDAKFHGKIYFTHSHFCFSGHTQPTDAGTPRQEIKKVIPLADIRSCSAGQLAHSLNIIAKTHELVFEDVATSSVEQIVDFIQRANSPANSPAPRVFILDTDGGVDDAFAILLALRSPDIRLEAITTVAGNVPVDQATKNVLFLLEFFKLHRRKGDETDCHTPLPPVYIGAAAPLIRSLYVATHVHGSDGLGEVTFKHRRAIPPRQSAGDVPAPRSLATYEDDMAQLLANTDREYDTLISDVSRKSAVDAIIEIVARHPTNTVTIVTIGPMTNIAMATRVNPTVMAKVKQVVVMGGAFETYGNTSVSAEYNIWVDPESARVSLDIGSSPVVRSSDDISASGAAAKAKPAGGEAIPRLLFVPLDVTHKVPFGEPELSPYRATSVVGRFFDEITSFIRFQFKENLGEGPVMHMHDPLAVAVAIDQSLATRVPTKVSVETHSELSRGKTLADLRTPRIFDEHEVNALVCVDVDIPRFWKMWTARVMTEWS